MSSTRLVTPVENRLTIKKAPYPIVHMFPKETGVKA